MRACCSLLIIILLLAWGSFPGRAAAQPAASAWPMFHARANHDGRSAASSLVSPVVRWASTLGDSVFMSSPAIGPDGAIYVGSVDRYLYAVHPHGGLRWKFRAGGAIRYSSPAIAADGTVYFGAMDSTFYAVNPNGTLRWSYRAGSTVRSSPAIAPDGTIYFGAGDNRLYALNPSGTLKWSHATGGNVRSSPAIGPDGTIYAGSDDSKLYALNPADGSVKWTFALGSSVDLASPTVGPDSVIYMGSNNGLFYAIRPTGAMKWVYATAHSMDTAPAILPGGNVVITTGSDVLVLDAQADTLIWKFVASQLIRTSPAVTSDGTIYAGSDNDSLFALDASGALKWVYRAGGTLRSSPAVGSDGAVFFGSCDGRLYALGSPIASVSEIHPPAEPRLLQPYPNPSRGSIRFAFAVRAGERASLKVFDSGGRLVRSLFDAPADALSGSVTWDGRDEWGRNVPSGLYWAVLESPGGAATRKVVRLR